MKNSTIIIIGIIVFIFWITLAFFLSNWSEDRWDKECANKGLQKGCTGIDECKKNCIDFGKEYYKYEMGGIAGSIKDCWCKENGEPKQIW